MAIPASKTCIVCGQDKKIGCFNRSGHTDDGFVAKCKGCLGKKVPGTKYQKERRREQQDYQNAWRAANPERLIRTRQARLGQIKSTMDASVSRLSLLDRDGPDCFYCGVTMVFGHNDSPRSAHLEHKTPLSRGGTHSEDNCVLACRSCNLSKGTKTAEEFASVQRTAVAV